MQADLPVFLGTGLSEYGCARACVLRLGDPDGSRFTVIGFGALDADALTRAASDVVAQAD